MKRVRQEALRRRHERVRTKVAGTADRPRLCIHKTLRHLYVQLVDDQAGKTLVALTTNTKANKAEKKSFRNIEWAKKLGSLAGQQATQKGVAQVVFDRGGYPYHGIVRAFADAAREAGLKF